MQSVVLEFVRAHWDMIRGIALAVAAVIVNGLINGLRDYPRCETWLHMISDFLSWAHPKNSLGTFKLPGKRSLPPPDHKPYERCKNGKHRDKTKPGMPTAVVLLLALPYLQSCCHLHGNCPKAVDVAYDCAQQEVINNLGTIGPMIADVLLHGTSADGDMAAIAKLLGSNGLLIIGCIVEQYYHTWTTQLASAKPGAADELKHGIVTAETWLAAHKPQAIRKSVVK